VKVKYCKAFPVL